MEQAAIGSQFRYLNKSFGIMVILAQPLPSLFFSLSIELASQGATELVGRNMELSNQFKFRFESGTAAVMGAAPGDVWSVAAGRADTFFINIQFQYK